MSTSTLALIVVFVIFFILYMWKRHAPAKAREAFKDTNKDNDGLIREIPGHIGLPYLGGSWTFTPFIGLYSRDKQHEAMEAQYKRFGPVVCEQLWSNFPLIHLFDKDDIFTAFKNEGEYPMRPPNMADVFYRRYKGQDVYLNDGIVNINGAAWHKLRSLLTPPLTNRATLKRYVGHMNLMAEDFVTLLTSSVNKDTGVVDNLHDIVYRAGLETVCCVALEKRMGFLESTVGSDIQIILESIQGYNKASAEAMYGVPYWQIFSEWFKTGLARALIKHKDNLCDRVGRIVDESLAEIEGEAPGDFNEDPHEMGILKQLLNNKEIDIRDVKASTIDYINAGVDTIGNSIIFALALIAKDQRVQTRLQEELDNNLAPGEELTPDKIAELKYLKACVKESFRMYPTASQIARVLNEPMVTKSGKRLPQYTVVLCNQRIASLQEENFTNAREFIPERWMEGGELPNHEAGLVLPFGFGKKSCPGKKLAEQEIYIMIAKLYQTCNVSLVNGDFGTVFNFLLMPSPDMPIRITPRYH